MVPELSTPRPGAPRRARRAALVVVVGLAPALFLAEIVARAFAPHAAVGFGRCFDAALGWKRIPGFERTESIEGASVRLRYNALGFRGADPAVPKPPGVRRLVAVGDSFTEAAEVDLEETFAALAAERLGARTGNRWEAVNLGGGDYGPVQEWIALERLGFALAPDIVVWQLFAMNDVGNSSPGLRDLCQSGNDALRPYFVERAGALAPARVNPVRAFLRRNLFTFRTADLLLLRASAPPVLDDAWRMRELAARGNLRLDPLFNAFSEDADQIPPVAEGWRIVERVAETLSRACRARGIPLIVVSIPWDGHLQAAWAQNLAWLPRSGRWIDGARVGSPDPEYADRRLAALFRRLEIPFVPLKPVFDRYEAEVRPARHGHLNPAAHRRTAEALAEAFDPGDARR